MSLINYYSADLGASSGRVMQAIYDGHSPPSLEFTVQKRTGESNDAFVLEFVALVWRN